MFVIVNCRNKIESLLLDISRFLFEQPSEIVIVELSHMGSGDPNTVDCMLYF